MSDFGDFFGSGGATSGEPTMVKKVKLKAQTKEGNGGDNKKQPNVNKSSTNSENSQTQASTYCLQKSKLIYFNL